jgi:hypothetical protein
MLAFYGYTLLVLQKRWIEKDKVGVKSVLMENVTQVDTGRRLTDWHVLDRHPSRDVDGGVKGTRGCFWLVIKYV